MTENLLQLTPHVLLLVPTFLSFAAFLELLIRGGRVLESGDETFNVIETVVQDGDVAFVAVTSRRGRIVVALVLASDVLSVLRGLERLSSRSSDRPHVLRADFLSSI